ncbi:uncharacterized protein [Macrobrachium rosenbergii]|uniref:uncharacterized protein n=1 Tax=Macrobrachium rosenbergii TaxID=79674 RepID=UPI0034D6F402
MKADIQSTEEVEENHTMDDIDYVKGEEITPSPPPFIPLPVPSEYFVQWPPPSKQISKPSPVPVPWHPIDLPPGDPKIDSQSLPVPLPGHAPDLYSRDPSLDPLSSPGLGPLPVLVRELDSPDQSRSSPTGVASQPVPELVITSCEPPTPTRTSSSLSQSSADTSMSKDSATPQLTNELKQLQRLVGEPVTNAPASAIKEAELVALRWPPQA